LIVALLILGIKVFDLSIVHLPAVSLQIESQVIGDKK